MVVHTTDELNNKKTAHESGFFAIIFPTVDIYTSVPIALTTKD